MTEPTSTPRYCRAIKLDGNPCKAWASKTTGLCPLHSENSHQIHVLGGKSKSRAHQLETRIHPKLKPMVELLSKSAVQVHAGEITPAQGSAIASIATALIKAVESTELQTRLDELERKLMQEPDHAKF